MYSLCVSSHVSGQVLAVIECRVSGALASALGLGSTCASGLDLECHRHAAHDCCACLWGRVVLMRLEGSGSDAVPRTRCSPASVHL
jgi:hypothetical protein